MEDAAPYLNELHRGTWASELGVVIDSATRDQVCATVNLRPQHRQPYGLVHGGVYSGIVETVASVGAGLDARTKEKNIVGLENSTSFVRAVREGTLRVVALPITRGRRSQLWDVTIRTEGGAVVATGRVRFLLLDRDAEVAGGVLLEPDRAE